jgi:hypothetical protein
LPVIERAAIVIGDGLAAANRAILTI